MKKEILNVIEKQKLFDEYMEKVNELGKLSPAQQLRAILELENFLVSIYERGYNIGYKKGLKQSIDILKN
jgi:hypothetical protein